MVDRFDRLGSSDTIRQIDTGVISCRRCPRLVAWREEVARNKRAAYSHEDYWGRPVPGFGDPKARLLVVLGKFAFDQLWRILQEARESMPSPRPHFGHGLEVWARAKELIKEG